MARLTYMMVFAGLVVVSGCSGSGNKSGGQQRTDFARGTAPGQNFGDGVSGQASPGDTTDGPSPQVPVTRGSPGEEDVPGTQPPAEPEPQLSTSLDYVTGSVVTTDWFSEEKEASAFCNANSIVVGLSCAGDYCDDLRLHCLPVGQDLPLGDLSNSERFSDEDSPPIEPLRFVSGMRCHGDYCDDLTLSWKTFDGLQNSRSGSCYTTANLSEEDNDETASTRLCDYRAGFSLAGVICSGDYCDDKKLRCCQ